MNDIRFIHVNESAPIPRMTIAYRRTECELYWAVAHVNPKDIYVKKIGAEIAKKRLEELEEVVINGHKLVHTTGISFDWGQVDYEEFLYLAGLTGVLSDQQRANSDFYSFKHSYLSQFILNQCFSFDGTD